MPARRDVVRRGVEMSEAILYSSSDRIGVITLNRPEARNAVNRDVALGLEAAIDCLENDPDVWVGVPCANPADQARPVVGGAAGLRVLTGPGATATAPTG